MSDTGFLPYGRQLIADDDIAAVERVLRSDYLTTGPAVDAFEARLAEATGAPYAVVCSSGTAALHLACLALSMGAADVGVVPAVTFVATANALRYCGAGVEFSDVEPDSGLTDVAMMAAAVRRVEARTGSSPRVLLPVHLNGQPRDPEGIRRIADGIGAAVIEDGCHALGAEYRTVDGIVHKIGACDHSDMTVFSFHPVKTIAAGEGGAITTRDPELYRRLRILRSHGIERSPERFAAASLGSPIGLDEGAPWYHELQEVGFNYRLSDIHAALGWSQMAKLPDYLATRRRLAQRYDDALAPLGNLVTPVCRISGAESAFHLYAVLIDFAASGTSRADLMTRLGRKGIGTQVHYLPVPFQPYYFRSEDADNWPGAVQYYNRQLSLPLYASLTEQDVDRVCQSLTEELQQ